MTSLLLAYFKKGRANRLLSSKIIQAKQTNGLAVTTDYMKDKQRNKSYPNILRHIIIEKSLRLPTIQ